MSKAKPKTTAPKRRALRYIGGPPYHHRAYANGLPKQDPIRHGDTVTDDHPDFDALAERGDFVEIKE